MVSLSAVVCFAVLAAAAATDVKQCSGFNFSNLSNDVTLTPCRKVPCKLKKGTSEQISIQFTPDEDVKEIKSRVSAVVLGVPLPFVGVDGNSICEKIFTEDGEKAACPLKGGTKYFYKDSFPILPFYPNVNVDVHWALVNGANEEKTYSCFEVPAKIV